MFHYTIITSKTTSEAIQSLEEHLAEEKFGVLWSFNIKDKLNAKGLDYDQNFYVLEVCNPFEAHDVLSKTTMVGYFLPCKIVVYEKNDKTHIGMVKPTALIGILDDQELDGKAKEIEDRLIACINKVN